MRSERITMALDSGALSIPESGTILVLRPRFDDDLTDLPKDRLALVTGFRPDYDALRQQGYAVTASVEGQHSAALVCVPRARDLARALLADAAKVVVAGGTIYVDGQKTDGIEAIWRDLRDIGAEPSPAFSKAHGRIFSFAAGVDLSAWAAKDQDAQGFITRPGVFSADGPDRASVLLADALPEKLPARIIDLGAGWGFLSQAALGRQGAQEIHLVEAEAEALACAQRNITDPRAQFHWADALRFKPEIPVHAVICNPPFHTTREADPNLGMNFIRAAAQMLTTSGTLWLVANRHLPYDKVLTDTFKEVEDIGGDRAFRVIRAFRPIQVRK